MTVTTDLRDHALGHQFNPSRFGDDFIRWFDQAQKAVFRRARIKLGEKTYTFETVANDHSYPLPSDFGQIRNVRLGDRGPLRPIEVSQYDRLDQTSKGMPVAYVTVNPGDNEDLKLWPIPSRAYTIRVRYWRMPPKITAVVDPILPEDYHDLLIHYALKRAYEKEHDYEAAQYHAGEYQARLVEFMNSLQSERQEPGRVIPGGWDMGGDY